MQTDDKKAYYDIITRCWKAFAQERRYPEFSSGWWQDVIADFEEILQEYKDSKYSEFANSTAMNYLKEQERRQLAWRTQH